MRLLHIITATALTTLTYATNYKPVVLDNAYSHDKFETRPKDQVKKFAAFTVSFDGDDDNDGDDTSDKWGIPEWVSYEIKGGKEKNKSTRPSRWIADKDLVTGTVPTDETYKVSGTRELKQVKGNYRFVRGHMCPKATAEYVSANAAYNTHTTLNAVPQLQWQNNGIWKLLESDCVKWADLHDSVWVTCGPVFFGKSPAMWLGQGSELKAAIPDALFKIIIRETDGKLETMAFIFPNIIPSGQGREDYKEYLVPINYIEKLTGLDFMSSLSEEQQEEIEKDKATEIWTTEE
ncbi:MAG: DNA/RNA non-specific endonuclease [Lentisphaeraceae bacterium]|nr:DNA/RNA non-specific endonuclease [Lentisphaeraceae bacterium]